MSTYLLAAVIGEYDYIEDKDSDGVLIRVYTPLGKKEQGRFALEVVLMKYVFTHDVVNIFLCVSLNSILNLQIKILVHTIFN